VLNLDRWIRTCVTERVLSYMREHSSMVNEVDQDGLNAILAQEWRPLDPRWNRQTAIKDFDSWPESLFKETVKSMWEDLQERPFVDHFTGPDKPWDILSKHPSRRKFLRYLRESGWFSSTEFHTWKAVRTMRIPEQYLRRYTRPLRHRIRGLF